MTRDQRHDRSDAHSIASTDSGVVMRQELYDNDLHRELQRVKEDLKSKDNEVQKAYQLKENTDREIQDLTASLFESAHSMVEQAKQAQANAEEKLKHSNQTIDALTLENTQLKKSVSELKKILHSCRSSSDKSRNNLSSDNILLREFLCWEQKPSIGKHESLFMYRIYNEDILPCLLFPNTELSATILSAMEKNDAIMELSPSKDAQKMCSLTGELCSCDYRIRLGENTQWHYLTRLARNRIASVGDFFTYIRHVQSGLVKSDAQNRFNKVIQLRQQMAFARLGL